jgi:hypothetical protein
MPSVTMRRLDDVQRWPALKERAVHGNRHRASQIGVIDDDERILAAHLELDARTGGHAAAATDGPTSCEPVNVTASRRRASERRPSTDPGPRTRFSTPGGRPARCTMSAIAHGDAGTSSAGLNTTVLPHASAGAIFQAGIASGKFHGVIAATTPSGSR